jgi:YbbR domain-containing protein
MNFIKQFTKNLPTIATAIFLAIAVWILAVTNIDPVEKRTFGRPVPLEVIGQDPSLVITTELPEQISIILSAPASTWGSELNSSNVLRALIDLTGLDAGNYKIPVKLQINARPVKVESFSPDNVSLIMEKLFSESFTINLLQPSSPAVGYEAGVPELSVKTATVNGPTSLVDKVSEVRATLDIGQSKETIDRDVVLSALDENGLRVSGVSISPEKVHIRQEITQRGGYKNVTVKVITSGQIASGHRLTNISANPLVVTVFSTDPELINTLPGFIETQPLNLTGAGEDLEVSLPLKPPSGVVVVGESTIRVSVSISPIEGSITLTGLPIEIIGISPAFQTVISPDRVDVILSGPLPELDALKTNDVRIILDLTDNVPGTYQIEPQIQVGISGILVESILPATIEVEIKITSTATPGN